MEGLQSSKNMIEIYLEFGKKKVFASALEWPGWCRSGQDEAAAIQALLDYCPRYQRAIRSARLDFQLPEGISVFHVADRLEGNMTTDFGAPDIVSDGDFQLVDDNELKRLEAILKACWRAFDKAIEKAQGKTLRTGPRGGGRSVEQIVNHVTEAEMGYRRRLGGESLRSEGVPLPREVIRLEILKTLGASVHGEIDPYGPRGGKRWPARFFVRREAWHVLDHLWEIEDRTIEKRTAER